MLRSRLKNIINKSKEISNKKLIGDSPFETFKSSLPKELVKDSYRLEDAWKSYGLPSNLEEAIWLGMVLPVGENDYKLPSIGYNEETDEYEYLNKGEDNEVVAKDIRVWDNDVIPFVKELKHGGYVRTFNEEKDCWTYTKNSQKKDTLDLNQFNILKKQSGDLIEEFKYGGKKKIKIKTEDGGFIEINSLDEDLKAGRKSIGKYKGVDLYMKGDGTCGPNYNGKQVIDSFLKGGKSKRNIELLITYANNLKPPFILRILNNDERSIPLIMEDGKKHHGTHLLSYGERDGKTYVFPEILDFDGDLIRLNWPTNLDIAIEKGDFLEMDPEEAELFTKEYKKFYPNYKPFKMEDGGGLSYFKQGGQMSVIPEGALHARKNHMEGAGEDFTAKGIPVVDNNGELQAEIEKEEWTMTKELTDDVENWYRKYYDKETSEKDKDELAIKCGKRITEELLHNTDDRANLITKMLEEEE